MRALAILMMTALPFAAFAAGSDDTAAPTPTQTSEDCKDGEIWDEKTSLCVAPETTGMNNDTRFLAVRELAYAGRPDDALRVLASMTEGKTDRVLTYLGFANRKAGRLEEGLAYYAQALIQRRRAAGLHGLSLPAPGRHRAVRPHRNRNREQPHLQAHRRHDAVRASP